MENGGNKNSSVNRPRRGNVPFHRLVRFRAVTFGSLPLVACVLETDKNYSPDGHDGDYGILDVNI